MSLGTAWGEDWPQWGGGPQRNMASREKGLPSTFAPGKRKRDRLGIDLKTTKNVRWVARLGTENYSAPVIADGRVIIGTNDEALVDSRYEPTRGGLLLCLNEATGETLWQLVVPRLEIDRSKVSEDYDDMNLGICSTATVEEDRVYIVTNRCEILCLDLKGFTDGNDGPFTDEAHFSVSDNGPGVDLRPTDADIIWRFDMLRDLPVFPHDAANCGILIHGDYIYTNTCNGVYDGKVVLPSAPSFIALNKWTGQLMARDPGRISPHVFHGQWSSPTLGNVNGRSLIFYGAGDGACYAFEPLSASPKSASRLLNEVWRFDCNPGGYRERGGKVIDYWELVRNGTQGALVDGQIISPSEIIGTPVFHEGKLYVAIGQDPVHGKGRGALTCIDPSGEGEITSTHCVWQYKEIGRSMSTVSIADGLLYIAETFGKVHCLDAKTGQVHWIHDANDDIWSSTLVADGKVYLGTRRGLTVLKAGTKYEQLADIRLGSQVRSSPAAANGVLFIASQKNLWAVEEE